MNCNLIKFPLLVGKDIERSEKYNPSAPQRVVRFAFFFSLIRFDVKIISSHYRVLNFGVLNVFVLAN